MKFNSSLIFLLLLFTQVFRDQDLPTAPGRQGQKVAESILRFFSGFDAFALPLPSADVEVMQNLSENKVLLQSKFLSGLEQFKSLLRSTLVPKCSYTNGEFVTGEGEGFLTECCITTCSSLMGKLIFEMHQ